MKRLVTLMIFLLAVMLVPAGAFALTSKAQARGKAGTSAQKGAQNQEMMNRCKEMAEKRNEMMAKMKEMDQRLQAKVDAMDAATGDAKIAAMEGVIKEMVTQRQEMQNMMASMHKGGMGPMMCCMGPGGMSGMPAGCPMMKGTQGAASGRQQGAKQP